MATTTVLSGFALLEVAFVIPATSGSAEVTIGMDARLYVDAANRWLEGGGFYLQRQLTGEPYEIMPGDVLYPPTALLLLVPFALGLAPLLWWVIPTFILFGGLVANRPALWALPLIAAVACYPRTWAIVIYGNVAMWAIAGSVAGVVWGWPALGAMLKPTLAPFALAGARHRSWWIGLVVVIAVSLPFGALWFDFLTAIVNAQNHRGLEYPLGELPIIAALVVAAGSRPLSVRLRALRPAS